MMCFFVPRVGMKHDDSDNPDVPGDCPSMEYIMSSSEYVAMESNVETYNKFSECSARYVHKFTSQLVNPITPLVS